MRTAETIFQMWEQFSVKELSELPRTRWFVKNHWDPKADHSPMVICDDEEDKYLVWHKHLDWVDDEFGNIFKNESWYLVEFAKTQDGLRVDRLWFKDCIEDYTVDNVLDYVNTVDEELPNDLLSFFATCVGGANGCDVPIYMNDNGSSFVDPVSLFDRLDVGRYEYII